MKFYVTLQLIEYHAQTLAIEADGRQTAISMALSQADDLEFKDLTDSEVEVSSVEQATEPVR